MLREKAKMPGPGFYKPKDDVRPLSGKIGKNARKTVVDAIFEKCKKENTPGPASYFKRPKSAQVTKTKVCP